MIGLKLASYNIHGCLGWDRRTDPDRIARILGELDADVIALQEVASRLGEADLRQFDFLTAATGMEGIPGPTLLRPDCPCGTALLTRHRVEAVRRIDLSVPAFEPRGALDVDLTIGPLLVRVVVTHLGLRVWERRQQVERLLKVLAGERSDLVILMGDINEWLPLGLTLRRLRAHFGKHPSPRTFPSLLPLSPLDRILVRPRDALTDLKVKTYKTLRARLASDHLPLLAKLVIPGGR